MNNLLKKFDYFGVELHFLYESKIKYYSSTGGVIFILFLILSLVYVGCNISSFVNRENMTLIFYDSKLEKTDEIDFENFTSRFGYKFSCSGYEDDARLKSIFQMKSNHVTMLSENGERVKHRISLNHTLCTKQHFYNEFNESVDINGFEQNLHCPNIDNQTVGGLYQDEIFKYFEIGIEVDKNTDPDEVQTILKNHECRLEIYHVDTTINVYDYKNPVKRYIASEFSTLKANTIHKMNLFFKLQSFTSYENYLFDKYSRKYYVAFSYAESYADDKGYDRFEKKPYGYNVFAKIYIRSGLQRSIIQRKYMKLTEFAANMSSILSEILLILYVVVRYINYFYAQQSVIKKIFQFKDVYKNEKNKFVIKKMKDKFVSPQKNNYFGNKENNNNKDNLNLSKNNNDKKDDNSVKNSSIEDITSSLTKNIFHKESMFNSNQSSKVLVQKPKSHYNYNNNQIDVKMNFFEIIIKYLVPCIKWAQFQIKRKLFNSGFNKLCFQLDVLTYLKKIQEIELIKYILLEPSMYNMIHFLAKPSISVSNQKNPFDYLELQYNVDVNEKEINDFYDYLKYLNEKSDKTNSEKRLIDFSVLQLNNLLFSKE